ENFFDAGLLRGLLRLVEEGRHRDQEPGARILELFGKLVGSVERVGGSVYPAQRRDGEEDDRVLRHVRAVDPEHVALLEAALSQARRGSAHALSELAVREGA